MTVIRTGDAPPPSRTVLDDIADERRRQDEKWGEQNHPDGTGSDVFPLDPIDAWAPALYLEGNDAGRLAVAATRACQAAAEVGNTTWRAILLEEVFEALAESDPAKLRVELVQVAAVCTQWAEGIDRREGAA